MFRVKRQYDHKDRRSNNTIYEFVEDLEPLDTVNDNDHQDNFSSPAPEADPAPCLDTPADQPAETPATPQPYAECNLLSVATASANYHEQSCHSALPDKDF
ncbi:hypothetical protein BWQ96_09184 [Gracilariopsis chorda]|uniref:Uncharacterized protein n=1 Tax=Gracilariopsis chorda TaxID=448386 RepID=A0A2V3IG88_9FLOR|nr:hypothetical protein BWQ96_09180 [Gracilariopsis chorda]PXF41105.1 hypothetical protein BWQ96_09184 [Gracilariopsis chorda]|eukprot:PXF41101.1 hypothetical protein BWQ96_09180 [Gracilariopsis chorda]